MTTAVLIAITAIFMGAVVQGSIGFGFSLTAAPILVLLRPEAVPVTLLCLALPMTSFMALKERHSLNMPAFAWIIGGMLPGTVIGVALLAVVPDNSLARFLGILISVASLASFVGPRFKATSMTQLSGGIASGIMNTAAALGGPPLALVNQRSSGASLRSTLALSFLVGVVMSLTALWVAGRVEVWHLFLALKLLPGLLLGLWTSRWIVSVLDERWLRPVILAFAAVAGLLVLVLGSVE